MISSSRGSPRAEAPIPTIGKSLGSSTVTGFSPISHQALSSSGLQRDGRRFEAYAVRSTEIAFKETKGGAHHLTCRSEAARGNLRFDKAA